MGDNLPMRGMATGIRHHLAAANRAAESGRYAEAAVEIVHAKTLIEGMLAHMHREHPPSTWVPTEDDGS